MPYTATAPKWASPGPCRDLTQPRQWSSRRAIAIAMATATAVGPASKCVAGKLGQKWGLDRQEGILRHFGPCWLEGIRESLALTGSPEWAHTRQVRHRCPVFYTVGLFPLAWPISGPEYCPQRPVSRVPTREHLPLARRGHPTVNISVNNSSPHKVAQPLMPSGHPMARWWD